MRIKVLGSSSFIPTVRGSWSSFLIDLGKDHQILVDAGSRRLIGIRRDVLAVNDIYITHRHPDHILFLGGLIRRMRRNKRTDPLNIYSPVNAFYRLQGFIRFYNPKGIPTFVKFNTFTPDDPEFISRHPESNSEVWAAGACHTTMAAGYGICQDDKKIVIVPDTTPNCSTMLALAKDATAFFHDCTFPSPLHELAQRKGHSDPEGAGQDAAQANVKQLILIHTSHVRSLDKGRLIKAAQQDFKGKVDVATDNSIFTF